MTDMTRFEFPVTGHQLRVFEIDGEHHFQATDVATMLGYRDANHLTRGLSDDEKGTHNVGTLGGRQTVTVITEPGLYHALSNRRVGSIKDETVRSQVEAFQRWVNHDVLPTIRQTGSYALQAPQKAPAELTRMEVLQLAIESEEARLAAEARAVEAETQLAITAPKAEEFDRWISLPDTLDLDTAGKMLGGDDTLQALGVKMGPKLLRDALESWGWMYWNPAHTHRRAASERVKDGTFKVKAQSRPDYDSETPGARRAAEPQVRVTRAGVDKIYKRLVREATPTLFGS